MCIYQGLRELSMNSNFLISQRPRMSISEALLQRWIFLKQYYPGHLQMEEGARWCEFKQLLDKWNIWELAENHLARIKFLTGLFSCSRKAVPSAFSSYYILRKLCPCRITCRKIAVFHNPIMKECCAAFIITSLLGNVHNLPFIKI